VILSLIALAAGAADYPAPNTGDWVARDFRFHTGEVLPELRLHYTTRRVDDWAHLMVVPEYQTLG
jgi:homoserine O-acetyltransferase